MSNLANDFFALRRPAEAVGLHEKVLALRKAKLGPEHPDTLTSLNNLANSYAALGRLDEALKLREEALALWKAKLGPDHPATLWSMGNLAESLIRHDRWSEAMAILDDCLRRVEGKAVDPRLVASVLELRLRAFAKQRDASGCRQAAAMWERLDRKDADSLYGAACLRAITAAVFRSKSSEADGARQAGLEADLAMAWLSKAVAAGYDTPQHLAHMTRDPDLDAFRDRDDFRRLMAGLMDRVFPADPFAL
jgi:tetratricopeptide (TPR) repeat protein